MFIEKVYATVPVDITETHGRFTDLASVFGFVLNLFIGIGWALVFIMLALGFIQYITSRGEKTAVESAQKWLTYAVIGGIGLFFISFVRRVVPAIVGVEPGGVINTSGGLIPF